jgi:YD repeat-containing protein
LITAGSLPTELEARLHLALAIVQPQAALESSSCCSTAPDKSSNVSTYSSGVLISTARYDSLGKQIGRTTYSYDPHGRQSAVTDARNGATSYTYNNADLVATVTTPNPGGIGSPQTTTTFYNTMLQASSVLQPDGTSVAMTYLPTGELGATSGSRTYPVAYSYDYAGRMKTMTNWSNFAAGTGGRVTTWNYDPNRGFLIGKLDASTNGPTYTYTLAGRLASRTWARGVTTTYSNNPAGDLAAVKYTDTTQGLTNSYDRMGRKTSVSHGPTTISLAYDWANDLLSESYLGGALNGLTVTNQFDPDLRRVNMALLNGGAELSQAIYAYDNASRLASVSDGVNSAAYLLRT